MPMFAVAHQVLQPLPTPTPHGRHPRLSPRRPLWASAGWPARDLPAASAVPAQPAQPCWANITGKKIVEVHKG